MSNIHATARVQLTVEITGLGGWGDGCSIQQIHKQASEDALGKFSAAIVLLAKNHSIHMRVVGEPKVNAIITERAS